MTYRKLIPALLLSLAVLVPAAASAQSVDSITTLPPSPAPGDLVTLRLSGMWPDGCVPTSERTSVTRDGAALRVNFNYSGVLGPCTAAITPWSLDVPVGTFPEGTFSVLVTLARTFLPPAQIGSGSFEVTAIPEATIWLPGFRAPGAAVSLVSTLTAYNNADRDAKVEYLGAWDALGEATPPADAGVPAYAAAVLDSHTLREGQAVQMLSLRAPRRLSFRATLERIETVPEGSPKVPESLGRVELPVFTELFPAGMTAVAGDVSFSASECAAAPEARRRVNLTLFNAGDAAATFHVSAVSPGSNPGTGGEVAEYTVPAKSLVQFNQLPVDTLPVCEAGGAWFRITGDQPFLGYVSTVRPETLPGVLPYEIFPAQLDR